MFWPYYLPRLRLLKHRLTELNLNIKTGGPSLLCPISSSLQIFLNAIQSEHIVLIHFNDDGDISCLCNFFEKPDRFLCSMNSVPITQSASVRGREVNLSFYIIFRELFRLPHPSQT